MRSPPQLLEYKHAGTAGAASCSGAQGTARFEHPRWDTLIIEDEKIDCACTCPKDARNMLLKCVTETKCADKKNVAEFRWSRQNHSLGESALLCGRRGMLGKQDLGFNGTPTQQKIPRFGWNSNKKEKMNSNVADKDK